MKTTPNSILTIGPNSMVGVAHLYFSPCGECDSENDADKNFCHQCRTYWGEPQGNKAQRMDFHSERCWCHKPEYAMLGGKTL